MASHSTGAIVTTSNIDDAEEVLKAANARLKVSKNDPNAQHIRIVALLKLDRFDDALRVFDEGGDALAQSGTLEKAYAQYKVGKLEEAQKTIGSAKEPRSRGLKHIAAQVAYRSEDFETAAKLYKELSGKDVAIEGEENDLRINSSAVDAQLEWQGNGELVEASRKKPGREDLEAFETAYNAACGYIARGDLAAGSVLLKRSRDLCEALDELSDEEKKTEVLPIMVQQAYVLTKMGKIADAEVLQKMIQTSDVPELPTRVVAQNNEVAANIHSQNPYLAQRIFQSLPTLSKTDKLFEHQQSVIQGNTYALDLRILKHEGVERTTAEVLAKLPSPSSSALINTISVVNAAAAARSQTGKAALKQLLALLERRPNDVGLILTIIQMYVFTKNFGSAITLLESFFKRLEESSAPADQDVRFAPGLVGLLVSMYRVQGRKSPIQEQLRKAASHWKRKPKPAGSLLSAAGISLVTSSDAEDLSAASELFNSLKQKNAGDKLAIAGIVASKATTDFGAIESELDKLTPIDRLISGIDAAALENGGIASRPAVTTESTKKRAAPVEKEQPAKKKIRKSKMPKEFEEGKKMDPERWLPLRDRSSYKPKGKKGKKKANEATQGGVVKMDESLELVGGAGTVKVEKAPVGGGSNKAKKKKGKK